MKQKFAIVDVETTGGRAADEKITEIAIVIHDGERVVEQFSSLVNPERPVPFNITMLTGITNEMVATAPKFYEIAKKIVTITQDCIFVAHNVRFDYSFVQEEFRRLGYLYTKRQLCTVKLSRKTFPGLHSYSLENLIRHFNIPFQYRHRALDDTLATVNIFEKIITSAIGQQQIAHNLKQGIKETKLPNNITLEVLNNIPEVCGVYYFHNEKGDVVYVGKSINMQKRILEHFSDGSE
ncbi:MAG: exonuclease domain-containing protein, partial [Saprospiraceae bacterium]